MDTIPIPTPPMMRNATRASKLPQTAQPMALMLKNAAEISIVILRPM